ncbi:hypothetical protein HMPREF3198_00815 [Winkia neuii]|nr:hypothetical protein HMPREF3198_00815 [Winkia neuii]
MSFPEGLFFCHVHTAIGAGAYPVVFAQIRHYFLGSTALKKTVEKQGL